MVLAALALAIKVMIPDGELGRFSKDQLNHIRGELVMYFEAFQVNNGYFESHYGPT